MMKNFVLCALLVFTLALNAEAAPKDDRDKPPVVKIPKDKDKDNGPLYSVPDTGSTALLLGTAVLVLGLASRRMTIR
jgi:hypothetical protein